MTTRRTALVALAALAVLASGCLGAPGAGSANGTDPGSGTGTAPGTATHTPTAPGGTAPADGTPTARPGEPPGTVTEYATHVFDQGGLGSAVIEGGITHDIDDSTVGKSYVTTVATAAEVDRFNDTLLPGDAAAFVRNTSFESASLVVVQSFPASSHPDMRVEWVDRDGEDLRIAVNDSAEMATSDITVETLLVRVPGDAPERVTVTTEDGITFDSTTGVRTVTPAPTAVPEPTPALPYTATDDAENVDDPRDLTLRNDETEPVGYRLTVAYTVVPDCRDATPPCSQPDRLVELRERTGKLRPGGTLSLPDLAGRTGNYTVTVTASFPGDEGERRQVTRQVEWTVDRSGGDRTVVLADGAVTVEGTS